MNTSTQDKVVILMATYNGGKYISEQIKSIIDQDYLNWELWIRDDGSSDRTCEIIKRIASEEYRITFYEDNKRNLGSALNFGELLNLARNEKYVMFADQDDIWNKDKIRITLDEMKIREGMFEKDIPILVHTDLKLVDENLRLISNSLEKYIKIYPYDTDPLRRIIAQNYIYGCTMMLNNKLVNLSTPIPDVAEGHDYWVALIAASLGKIYYMNNATLLYRQHSNNVTGIKQGSLKNRIKRHFTKKGNEKNKLVINNSILQAERLYELYQHLMVKERAVFLESFLKGVQTGGMRSIYTCLRKRVYRQGLLRTMVYYRYLFSNKDTTI
ncbi:MULTISPECIES: glycosyltransferase family 2 protein [Shouchella]|uniref:glycosyltransferase family 2 protein n=1 Tax=Shouchella TaxID=2893057 RepID=UPI000BA72A44|nr:MULTISPECIES: glycosyltransferase family 2 protein [Shouchella]MCM3378790.1 glycosyltransferase family 2 protein [Shouchella rhizosphaerae]PAD17295.1 hypothetical protein CHH73_09870 [Shouchella clausii]